ncbi:MAG: hypothetical protein PHU51_01970 [Candidatus Nanoarchaeia archaeon]|nr:hypothetical protein [Candidatus Nanoarchaeia archaeon]
MNIFRIKYEWYEGEENEIFLSNNVTKEQFEKDLKESRNYVYKLINSDKNSSITCLPKYYEQIVWFLINKLNYVECHYDEDSIYYVDDEVGSEKIFVKRKDRKDIFINLDK